MLDLNPSVHFYEIELSVLIQEFERSYASVIHLLAGRGHPPAQFHALFLRDAGCRRFLDHLLVSALHRTITLGKMNGFAMGIGQDLKFDVPRVVQEFLQIDRPVPESRLRLGSG